jgi:hypothetical protein
VRVRARELHQSAIQEILQVRELDRHAAEMAQAATAIQSAYHLRNRILMIRTLAGLRIP